MKKISSRFDFSLNTWSSLLLIIIVASLFRFLWLDRIPVGVVHDELNYLLQAKSIATTGTDLTHSWNPLSIFFFQYPPGTVQAELPYLLFVPIVGLFPFSLLAAHATNALLGVATAIVLYFLGKELFGKEAGFIAGLVASVNPWFVYINRTAYEVTPAVFFFLLGLYVLIKAKQWYILWSFPLFLLGFYSYIGTKIIFPFIIIAGAIFAWKQHGKKFTRQYITLCLLALGLVAGYILFLKLQPGNSRMGELFSFSNPAITQRVDALRKATLVGTGGSIFDNKITIGITILVTKFFKIFSFDYLFVYGDNFFSMWHHGLFYFVDAIFLAIGVVASFLRSKKTFFFLLVLLFLGTIPQVIHGNDVNNFTPHIAFIFPWMLLFIALGIWASMQSFKRKIFKNLAVSIISIVYIFSVGNFFHVYFFQNPIENGYFGLADRILVRYVNSVPKNVHITVYSHLPIVSFERYLFYTNTTTINPEKIKHALTTGELTIGNITLRSCIPGNMIPTTGTAIIDYMCEKSNPPHRLTIPQLADGGEAYGIYNDYLCSTYQLQSYPSHLHIQDFAIESLPVSTFCQTFIISY
jgi:4-amino-4-deoxy-L-arabinose transferase-like glycosyltransferase